MTKRKIILIISPIAVTSYFLGCLIHDIGKVSSGYIIDWQFPVGYLLFACAYFFWGYWIGKLKWK